MRSIPRRRIVQAAMVLALVVVLLTWPGVARSRTVTNAFDPALSDATVHGFDDIEGADEQSTSFAFVVADTIITASTTGTTGFLRCEFESCWLDAPPEGILFTFDPPLAAGGIELRYGPSADHLVTFTGTVSTEVVQPDGGTFEMSRIDVLAAAAEIGGITSMSLSSDGFARWDDLVIVPGGEPAGEADLLVDFVRPPASVGYGDAFELGLDVDNDGPDEAMVTRASALFYPGTVVIDFDPSGSAVPGGVAWELGSVVDGGQRRLTVDARSPQSAAFTCDGAMLTLAVVRAETGDPNRANNLAVLVTPFSTTAAASAEDCELRGVDEDCDGRFDCDDDDCGEAADCPVELADFGRQTAPDEPPIPPGMQPAGQSTCQNTNLHGELVDRPAVCCGGRPCDACQNPSLADWIATCPPLDPNFKEAVPATNGLGYGRTAAGQTIEYSITYENIGGSDAHDVLILDVLDVDVDDNTLVVDDDGSYDPATRTVAWLDPVLPPHTPRSVRYSVAVWSDAELGTRVRNVATIVFPDAYPPTRIDTPLIEHIIPLPEHEQDEPNLFVLGCEPGDAENEWTVNIVNSGRGFAYDVTADILAGPAGFEVSDGAATFAHPTDIDPESLSCVVPWATTPSLDTITLRPPADWPQGSDPCSAMDWRILYFTVDGESHVIDRAAGEEPDSGPESGGDGGATDVDGDLGPSDAGADGCGCRTGTGSLPDAYLMICALFALVRPRRR